MTLKAGAEPGTLEVPVVRYGRIHAHAVSMREALDLIAWRAASGEGGFVLTPNVEHLIAVRNTPGLTAAYRRAFLSLADGMPLVAVSKLLRLAIREKVSGSDLFEPLMARCAADGLPVYFVGASPRTCETAGERLRATYPGIRLVGYDASIFDLDARPDQARDALRQAREAGARLIVLCLPLAKSIMLARFEDDYRPAVGIGVGVSLSFYTGEVRRAPKWMSRCGLEWLFRLVQEPRRLWHRYLVDYPQVLPIFFRMAVDRLRGRPLTETSVLSVRAGDARTVEGAAGHPHTA